MSSRFSADSSICAGRENPFTPQKDLYHEVDPIVEAYKHGIPNKSIESINNSDASPLLQSSMNKSVCTPDSSAVGNMSPPNSSTPVNRAKTQDNNSTLDQTDAAQTTTASLLSKSSPSSSTSKSSKKQKKSKSKKGSPMDEDSRDEAKATDQSSSVVESSLVQDTSKHFSAAEKVVITKSGNKGKGCAACVIS